MFPNRINSNSSALLMNDADARQVHSEDSSPGTGKRKALDAPDASFDDNKKQVNAPVKLSSTTELQVRASFKKQKTGIDEASLATLDPAIEDFKKKIIGLGINPANPIPDLESKCDWKSEAGLTHDIFRLATTAVLTWKHGPNAGKIYDVITIPNMPAPNKEEFLKSIDKGLHDAKAGILDARKIWTKLHMDYWGTDNKPGLQHLRFSNKELNQLISEIERTGTGTWLEKRNQELELHETYSYSDDEDNDVYIRYLFNKGMPDGINRFFQPSGVTDLSDMAASHITYSEALDGIINAGALLSSNMRKEKGLLLVSGEGGRGSKGYTSNAVSFSLFDKTRKFLSPGFGGAAGFSYPINFLINNENLKKLETSEGTLGGEGTIKSEVPLPLINAVSVPSFAMADIQRVLAQHGYSHIKILPLTTKVQ